ncbi:DUF1127 domain-containing protein [Epibacterium sp. SM1979]|uniref:DUF1127 domain-containing protein n=1 Tax=Tritonibacter litoralis TaxID=2662264 RepID=A0A843YEH7_9RHOB|nr:DUF1127 domain-containing protein [Tritonibacter litoralis]MQQ07712.1 DUF1127 domain-containing protein [Tritonibacter litoralis]
MAYLSSERIMRPARRSVFAVLAELAALRRQRKALARLSDVELADIGISRREADIEAARPFWYLPSR